MNATPIIENIPPELRCLPQFVLWKWEKRFSSDDAETKIPYGIDGRRAKSNDPATWAAITVVHEVYQRDPAYAGIGLNLTPPLIGLDLDHCRDPLTGVVVPRARQIIAECKTYAEISPRESGVKLVMTGAMPTADGRGKVYRKDPWGTGKGAIEIYQSGRMFCLTGRRFPGAAANVNDGNEAIAKLYRALYPPAEPRPARVVRTDVPETDRVRRARAYLARIPASVSGDYGHSRLFHAACLCVRFGLDDADALACLHEFNARAIPPWDDRDIERKLDQARSVAGHEAGSMLRDRTPARPSRGRIVHFTAGVT